MLSNSSYLAIAIFFLVGLLLFGIGSALVRSSRQAEEPMIAGPSEAQAPEAPQAPPAVWTARVDESLTDVDAAARLEMIERLALINTDWSRSILEAARAEERDAALCAAIDRALTASC
ncbi:MAG: hypothetical protein ACXWNK_02945 [Vulcanimicrobiaceae bacterium]